jgi:uncharacterized membrane protein YbaN (DUF454 family)
MGIDAENPRGSVAARSRLGRGLLIAAGSIAIALGLLGVFIPVLPTTPFLLLAAACYARSSARLHRWLHTNRVFGEYLRRYRAGEGLPLASKLISIGLLWLSLGASAFGVPARLWWVRVLLGGIGLAVTVHLLRIKTRR